MRKAFRSTIVNDHQVVSPGTITKAMLEKYHTSDHPPNLRAMNPYRDDGKDAMKFYTDPRYFFDLWYEQEMKKQSEKKKNKKKVNRISSFIIWFLEIFFPSIMEIMFWYLCALGSNTSLDCRPLLVKTAVLEKIVFTKTATCSILSPQINLIICKKITACVNRDWIQEKWLKLMSNDIDLTRDFV